MPTRISDVIGIDSKVLDEKGVFDRFLDLDSQLHVDPHLLSASSSPEMRSAHDDLRRYYHDVITILKKVDGEDGPIWREAVRRMKFQEIPSVALGYAESGTSGSGIGKDLALALARTALALVRAGVEDPEIFELVGLFEEGIGADRISDMTVAITYPRFLEFTQRIAAEIGCSVTDFTVGEIPYRLPADKGGAMVIFVPQDVLRHLPTAFSWSDVDEICHHNEEARARLNRMIGDTWKEAIKDHTKDDLKRALGEVPEGLRDLVFQYRKKKAVPYDFTQDPNGEITWLDVARTFSTSHPLDLSKFGPVTCENVIDVVRAIIDHFRNLVENNGLWETIYGKKERVSQRVFFGIADAYCRANGLDLSPEVNSGPGPVDFKVSSSPNCRVLVEVKLTTNKKLKHGYEIQIEKYRKSEQSSFDFFLVIRVSDQTNQLDEIKALEGVRQRARQRTPEIKVVDARPQASASKAKS